MKIYIYQITTSQYPEQIASPEELILLHEEGESLDSLDPASLEYTTTLGLNSTTQEASIDEFKDWWQSEIGTDIHIDLLADEFENIQEHRLNEMEELGEGQWSINTRFVAYKKSCTDSKDAALGYLYDSEIKNDQLH